jgi:hypothetical protein
MIAKIFHIPNLKRALSKRYVESKLIPKAAKVEHAVLASTGQLGKLYNPFHFVQISKDFYNRSQGDLDIENVFLRTYINGVPFGFIIWQHIQREYNMPRPEEVATYPGKFKFPKNHNSLIRFGISIPPSVSLEERLYIKLWGYVILKSSLGSFVREISDEVWIDKGQWISLGL